MDKKECLDCKKEFQPKKDAAKFCSDKCRVKHFRKNGKKNHINPVQTQVLYNAMLDMVAKMGKVEFNLGIKPEHNGYPTAVSYTTQQALKPRRSYEYYSKARIDCDNEEDWQKLKSEILSDEYLSSRQKSTLTN